MSCRDGRSQTGVLLGWKEQGLWMEERGPLAACFTLLVSTKSRTPEILSLRLHGTKELQCGSDWAYMVA